MEIKANLNYLHKAPRKVRQVIDTVRGLEIKHAETILRHLPRGSSVPLLKLLHSARANAENNFHVTGAGLYIKSIKVDQGPVSKRFMPRAFGRAATIRKKSCHISLVLATRESTRGTQERAAQGEAPVATVRDTAREGIERKKPAAYKKISSEKKTDAAKRTKGFAKKIFSRKVV